MSDLIRIKRGLKENLPSLALGELGLVTDEESLFIGGTNGNIQFFNAEKIKNYIPLTQDEFNSINTLLAENKTVYLKGSYTLSTPIIVKDDSVIIGIGDTIINCVSGINAIEFPANAQRIRIENLRFIGANVNTNVKCFSFNEQQGAHDNIFKNIKITNFSYGVYARDLFWRNTLDNFVFDSCNYSLYIVFVSLGASINNSFTNMYFVKSNNVHMKLDGLKQTTIYSVNFGVNNNEQCLDIGIGSYSISQANFEQDNSTPLMSGYSFMRITGNAEVQLKNALFYVKENNDNEVYAISAYENSQLILTNCAIENFLGVNNFVALNIVNPQSLRRIDLYHSNDFINNIIWSNDNGSKYVPKNRTIEKKLVYAGSATVTLGTTQAPINYPALSNPTILIMHGPNQFSSNEILYVDNVTSTGFTVRALSNGVQQFGDRTFNYVVFN